MNGQYLINVLNQLLKKNEGSLFSIDETASKWTKHSDVEILQKFCREGYAMAKKYNHFIIGKGQNRNYIGIPGRFILEEQPAGGETGFTLWQPLRGGETFYKNLGEMEEETAEFIYGYWIAALDENTLKITEV